MSREPNRWRGLFHLILGVVFVAAGVVALVVLGADYVLSPRRGPVAIWGPLFIVGGLVGVVSGVLVLRRDHRN